MRPSREFAIYEVGTRAPIGRIELFDAALPGVLILRFAAGEFQIETVPPREPEEAPPPKDKRRKR